MLYVLDPEPWLFGLTTLFAYQAFGYYARASEAASAEAVFHRTYIVGVGHAKAAFFVAQQTHHVRGEEDAWLCCCRLGTASAEYALAIYE